MLVKIYKLINVDEPIKNDLHSGFGDKLVNH